MILLFNRHQMVFSFSINIFPSRRSIGNQISKEEDTNSTFIPEVKIDQDKNLRQS